MAASQAGDRPGEEQPALSDELVIPPAPALSPAEQRATFALPDGFEARLVAAEPLVRDPVAAAFDEDGRLWVVEMSGYMPNIDGIGEREPIGAIVVLSDRDGDGAMDERRVFMDELVLPRAVLPMHGGALVIVPPDLMYCRDTDGDGRADEFTLVDTGLGGIHSPEHAANSPIFTLDNWIHLANHPRRYRLIGGRWHSAPTAGGGQWGLTKDDAGRVFFNTNSEALRGDLYSSHYAVRNPNPGRAAGVNVRVADDLRVWPARVTPGINRGYHDHMLRDGYLTTFTGACGPHIYRGAGFPREYAGNAFVAEPCGNLIKRYRIDEFDDGRLSAVAMGARREFMTSTDERFRPVNLFDGPDGALYVVDMYRGLIQHRLFVTSFLRRQVLERGLEGPLHMGRIWRIAHSDAPVRAPARLSEASWTELAATLADPDGWWRDTAQRLFVEEGRDSRDARELAREAFERRDSALGRLHALWALEGIGALERAQLETALRDADERVRHAGVRASESALARGDGELLTLVAALGAEDASVRVRHQVLLSLGEARTDAAERVMLSLLALDASSAERRSGVLSGLAGRELAFLEALLASDAWSTETSGRATFVGLLARCIVLEGRGDRIDGLFAAIAALPSARNWQRVALLRGLLAGRPSGPDGAPTHLRLARQPPAVDALRIETLDEATAQLALEAVAALAWPGRAGYEIGAIEALDERAMELFERGRVVYAEICAACHQSSGLGEPGKAPRLRHSPWLLGSKERLIRVVSGGLVGAREIDGVLWDIDMPGYSGSDEELAAVLTYARREWGHGAEPVSPAEVAEVRARDADRVQPWTAAELE